MKKAYFGSKEGGSAIMIVMGVSTILIGVGLAMTQMTGSMAHRVTIIKHSSQAIAVANAGISDMITALDTNYNWWKTNTMTASFAGGSYTVVSENPTVNVVVLTSTATVEGWTRVTQIELLGTGTDPNDILLSTNKAVHADGQIRIESDAVLDGDVANNGGSRYEDEDIVVSGNVFSVTGIDLEENLTVTGTTNPAAAPVGMPNFDFAVYKQQAIDNGIYYSASQTFETNTTFSPANGIVYIDGDILFEAGDFVLAGVMVSPTSIRLEGGTTLTQTQTIPGLPALLSEGTLRLEADNLTLMGAVYGGTSIRVEGNNVSIYGAIISGGTVRIEAEGSYFQPQPELPLWDPTQTNSEPLVIGGWTK